MLTQHQFYVYYQENRVYARRGTEAPVLAETLATPQDAYDKVQSIVNPTNLNPNDLFEPDEYGEDFCVGFHAKSFQDAISENCRPYVEAAYAR